MSRAAARRLAVVALLLLGPPGGQAADAPVGPAYVTRVVDGDTLFADLAGRLEAVRYLAINAPHIEHPTRGSEPYASAAREANRRLVEGKWIHLVLDDRPRDRDGRLLAYVWLGGLFVNAALVHAGYAEAAVTSTSTRYGDYLRLLEAGARRDRRGVWQDPEAAAHHRPRAAVTADTGGDWEERAADASGGRVFSAPAPFFPQATPGVLAPSVGVPAAPPPPTTGSPSYVVPRGTLRSR